MILLLDANSRGVSISSLTLILNERWAFRERRIQMRINDWIRNRFQCLKGYNQAEILETLWPGHRRACRAALEMASLIASEPSHAGGESTPPGIDGLLICFGWFLDSNGGPTGAL